MPPQLCSCLFVCWGFTFGQHLRFIGCWNFAAWQYLRSYLDAYRLATVHTHGHLYSAAPLRDQVISTMAWCPTSPEPTTYCTLLVVPNTKLSNDKYRFCKSLVWLDWESNSWPSSWKAWVLPIWPPLAVQLSNSLYFWTLGFTLLLIFVTSPMGFLGWLNE